MSRIKLKPRHRKFVKEWLKKPNGTRAVMKAYPDMAETTARNYASRLLKRDDVQNAIAHYAEGFDDDMLHERHLALINKNDADGQPETQGVAKGLDMAYKIKGYYKQEVDVNVSVDTHRKETLNDALLKSINQ